MFQRYRAIPYAIGFGVVLTLVACQPSAPPSAPVRPADDAEVAAPVSKAPPEFAPTGDMLAVLAEADRTDGSEDRVVARCPGCSLAMEGSAEHALDMGGYALHFCSDTCRDHFRENPESGMEALAEATPTVEAEPG